jgi:CRISPR system Cascade subunit CasB
MSKAKEHEQAFIRHLESLVVGKDRGALATLRRGLGKPPGTVHQMDRYVLRYLPESMGPLQEEPYYLVAALFAGWYQGEGEIQPFEGNLGTSLRFLVDKDTSDGDEAEKRIEKRLVALLNCHRDDLPEYLRHTISLLKSKNVAVNWAQLLHDIKGWGGESRDVQRSWARSFWAGSREVVETATNANGDTN